ncbi:hypothetical protein K461DRAFT_102141 [Myriangium duriaei CBS 260.36]|uniref:Uncharacterized protein n=1 Tax=Myriangium duriaei CBS 260.36 TaxID=1168546 RepID=A0A9P4J4Q6_9PEZI|nr:hypothetical protein K461DRAFT_102141 [Myriangium duriaei CBS 260.36]
MVLSAGDRLRDNACDLTYTPSRPCVRLSKRLCGWMNIMTYHSGSAYSCTWEWGRRTGGGAKEPNWDSTRTLWGLSSAKRFPKMHGNIFHGSNSAGLVEKMPLLANCGACIQR